MKAYTSLEQSRKLAKFLPLESADMTYICIDICKGLKYMPEPRFIENIPDHADEYDVNAWSLAALMNIFPKEEGSCTSISFGYYDANGNHINSWLCCYEKEGECTDDYIIETIPADNPIDACVEMILKLHELNLL